MIRLQTDGVRYQRVAWAQAVISSLRLDALCLPTSSRYVVVHECLRKCSPLSHFLVQRAAHLAACVGCRKHPLTDLESDSVHSHRPIDNPKSQPSAHLQQASFAHVLYQSSVSLRVDPSQGRGRYGSLGRRGSVVQNSRPGVRLGRNDSIRLGG